MGEAALLAVTLRRRRPDPDEKETESDLPKPVGLMLNGEMVVDDLGLLPVHLELDVTLRWDQDGAGRRVVLKHRVCQTISTPTATPVPGATTEGFDVQHEEVDSTNVEAKSGFYTTGVKYESAKALCLRGTGTIRVRLLYMRCTATDAAVAGDVGNCKD